MWRAVIDAVFPFCSIGTLRHAWLLGSGCGVYHGGSSPSRLLRLSLSKRSSTAQSPTPPQPVIPSPDAEAKGRTKTKDAKVAKTPADAGKSPKGAASRRPLTRSVLRASLSPLAGPPAPGAGSTGKRGLPPSLKVPGLGHSRRLVASATHL